MLFAVLLFGPYILNAITQFLTSWIESVKLQMVIAQYSPLNDGELWMSYQNMRWCFLQRVIEASRGGNEEEKLKFYITSCSFCLCNSAGSLQSLDHVGHVVSESGDSKYWELELILLTLVLLFVIAASANLLNHECPCKDQTSPSQSWPLFPHAHEKLLSSNQPISSSCCAL